MAADLPSEILLRQAALACYRNAVALHGEAAFLAQHGYTTRAVALAVVGLEEFAKALIYTLAAIVLDGPAIVRQREWVLRDHQPKHLIAVFAESAQYASEDEVAVAQQDAGRTLSREEYLTILLRQMAQLGLETVIGTKSEAREFYKDASEYLKATDGISQRYLQSIERKDAALYVDLTSGGELLTPDRVADRAEAEIRDSRTRLVLRPLRVPATSSRRQ